jgi:hypothetical protein
MYRQLKTASIEKMVASGWEKPDSVKLGRRMTESAVVPAKSRILKRLRAEAGELLE